MRSRRLHVEDDARAVQGARRSACRHRCASRFARGVARVIGEAGKGRVGRCAMAASIQKDAWRADTRPTLASPQARQPLRKPQAASPKPHPGRRVPKHPLIEVARSTRKDEALEQLEAWKRKMRRSPALEPADVLADSMRGRSSTWTAHPDQPSARAGGPFAERAGAAADPESVGGRRIRGQMAQISRDARKTRQARKPE